MTQDELRGRMTYDQVTGQFFWTKSMLRAGTTRKDGYVRICFNYKFYYAHQLAWFYMTGRWARTVDHKDHNPSNNSWDNLREATMQQQSCNRRNLKGFYFDKSSNRYRVLIQMKEGKVYGNSWKTEEEARIQAEEMKQKFHGDFYCG